MAYVRNFLNSFVFRVDLALHTEVSAWCYENLVGDYELQPSTLGTVGSIYVLTEREDDALLFSLRFECQ